jgi:hypothetical protein
MKENHIYQFVTRWKHNGEKHGGNIYAKSREEAEEMLKAKKETEEIIGYDDNPIPHPL